MHLLVPALWRSRQSPLPLQIAGVVLGLGVCLLVFVPFLPSFPAAGLDLSWMYAMNEAVGRQLRFGRDIIFTFGPLASIYTQQYHPATDGLMVVGSLLIGSGVIGLLGYAANNERRIWLALVGLFVAQAAALDAFLMLLPLSLLCASEKEGPARDRLRTSLLWLGAAACGLLPLVKGSITPVVLGCAYLAVIGRWTRGARGEAAGIPIAMLVAAIAAWSAAHQPLSGLPAFFRAQAPIITGYTEAMALPGRPAETLVYALSAFGLLVLSWRGGGAAGRWRICTGMALVLFIAFKAGFVRHDDHAMISGMALALVGLLIFLTSAGPRGAVALVIGLLGGVYILSSYHPMSVDAVAGRAMLRMDAGVRGIQMRWAHPEMLTRRYADSRRSIAAISPVRTDGARVDIYPSELSFVLASRSTWWPRPVIQSYSAYTGDLLRKNADHLLADGPDEIFLGIRPIDGRLPALDDGLSWPEILQHYQPVAADGNYVQFRRRAQTLQIHWGSEVQLPARPLGVPAALPTGSGNKPVWARIEVEPTLLGRLAALLYKTPAVHLVLAYPRHSSSFRLIPSIAAAGFLLSPTVLTTQDFLMLQSANFDGLVGTNERVPQSLTVGDGPGVSWFWKSFTVRVSTLDIPSDPAADRLIFSRDRPADAHASIPAGGTCSIEALNGVALGSGPVPARCP
ncbi:MULTISPECIES: hypothetical protein [Ramlibacter]|uniref:Glycosyltransferase RgtA/B/C/D-like domain-containing protein n=1 Tax=Ramlibacter aquaticus TaxID=2780094 RepID=A0ABR9SIM0_9BURK|nr:MULTISPECIES: hypothetical protein [Ramlibacter]MBE7942221.1 hypothetical protein [Ramlibacter aquaticus]